MQVPPDATAMVEGPDGKPTPTSDVTTFVQGYTGGAGRTMGGGQGRVWGLVLLGVVVGLGVVGL
jgi:hypothetical protein